MPMGAPSPKSYKCSAKVFKPLPEDDLIKQEFDIGKDEIIVSDIGRITYWKGQHVLIEAVNIVKNDFPKFKVLIVGSAEEGVGSSEYFSHLLNLTLKYQLQDRVIFTGHRSDFAAIINTSDIVVHTAVRPEPQGIIILEALLCKKPVIASDDAGSSELIKKYGGFLFQPGNANQLAEVLLKIFRSNNNCNFKTR